MENIAFLVKPWGTTNATELWHARLAANAAQDCFVFNPDYEPLPLDPDRYRLADSGLDLDRAVKDLMRQSYFKQLASSNLILVTAAPYSELGAVPAFVRFEEVRGKITAVPYSGPGAVPSEVSDVVSLVGFFYETDVLGDGKVSIISTYLWDSLPARPDLKVLGPSGRRAWEPYLLWAFAIIALDKLVDTECHRETLACPNDFCHNVVDIDTFFERGKWFCEKYCNPTIRKALGAGKFHVEQMNAIKRLLNRARGQPANDGYYSCFISYGTPDHEFAKKIYDDLKTRDIECWIYDVDSEPGPVTWEEINAARRSAERVLMICSSKSLTRPGVLKELEMQIDENRDKLIPISIDTEWLSEGFRASRGLADLIPFLRERNYADFVARPYHEALERLVKALHWK